MNNPTLTHTECAHCGQPINKPVSGTKAYCCYGCKVVDELLRGEVQWEVPASLREKYHYLEAPGIRDKLVEFVEGDFARFHLHLPAIHCSSCIILLENLPEVHPGILEVSVNFPRQEARISYQPQEISLAEIAAWLDYIGYTPDFSSRKDKAVPQRQRNLLIRLGVAGFFFGNTMLLALPEYLDQGLAGDRGFQHFFRYLMMGFSLPVVLYSAQGYFRSAYKALRLGFLNIDLPIALGVSVLFIRSAYEVLAQVGPGYFDSLTGLVFFLLIGQWYQRKTYDHLTFDRDIQSFLPLSAQLILPQGEERSIPVGDLRKGQYIRVRSGEVLPADARLSEAPADIDYSYITGESLPVAKAAGELVYAGARVVRGPANFEVVAPARQSYLNNLWQDSQAAQGEVKREKALTDRLARYFTPVLLLIALGAGLAWWSQGVGQAVLVFTAVLIVACPCALALAEPFANGSAMRYLGRAGLYLKDSAVLTRLSGITRIIFDKTGTLTRPGDIRAHYEGEPLSEEQWAVIWTMARESGHPLAEALMNAVREFHAELRPVPGLQVIDLSADGMTARWQGRSYRLGKASYLGGPERSEEQTTVHLEAGEEVLGRFVFWQPVRREVEEVVSGLKPHYKLSLLSGDTPAQEAHYRQLLGEKADLRFHCSPREKLEYLQERQSLGDRVLMLGDGLNDAGALQQSQVGVSLCEDQVHFFPASDALLRASALPGLPGFLALGRHNRVLIRRALTLSLLYNVVGVSFAAAGWLSPLVCAVLMPLSSVSVVLFTTLSTRIFARHHLKSKQEDE